MAHHSSKKSKGKRARQFTRQDAKVHASQFVELITFGLSPAFIAQEMMALTKQSAMVILRRAEENSLWMGPLRVFLDYDKFIATAGMDTIIEYLLRGSEAENKRSEPNHFVWRCWLTAMYNDEGPSEEFARAMQKGTRMERFCTAVHQGYKRFVQCGGHYFPLEAIPMLLLPPKFEVGSPLPVWTLWIFKNVPHFDDLLLDLARTPAANLCSRLASLRIYWLLLSNDESGKNVAQTYGRLLGELAISDLFGKLKEVGVAKQREDDNFCVWLASLNFISARYDRLEFAKGILGHELDVNQQKPDVKPPQAPVTEANRGNADDEKKEQQHEQTTNVIADPKPEMDQQENVPPLEPTPESGGEEGDVEEKDQQKEKKKKKKKKKRFAKNPNAPVFRSDNYYRERLRPLLQLLQTHVKMESVAMSAQLVSDITATLKQSIPQHYSAPFWGADFAPALLDLMVYDTDNTVARESRNAMEAIVDDEAAAKFYTDAQHSQICQQLIPRLELVTEGRRASRVGSKESDRATLLGRHFLASIRKWHNHNATSA